MLALQLQAGCSNYYSSFKSYYNNCGSYYSQCSKCINYYSNQASSARPTWHYVGIYMMALLGLA
jgi:hypothetical protein